MPTESLPMTEITAFIFASGSLQLGLWMPKLVGSAFFYVNNNITLIQRFASIFFEVDVIIKLVVRSVAIFYLIFYTPLLPVASQCQ